MCMWMGVVHYYENAQLLRYRSENTYGSTPALVFW